MPKAQVSGKISFDGNELAFRDEFSQPIVTVEFGKLSKTHETIGNDKITQIFGEKADRIRIEAVITQDQIETVYELTTVSDSKKTSTLILEEWSGEAVLRDSASIKPRNEVHQHNGSQYWLYDLTLPFIEVDRADGSGVQAARDAGGKNVTAGNPDFVAQKTGSSGNDSDDSGGDDSGGDNSDSEFPNFQPVSLEFTESELEGEISGFASADSVAQLAIDELENRYENKDGSWGKDISSVSTSNLASSRGGTGADEYTGEISYYHVDTRQTGTVEFTVTVTEESVFG